MRALLKLDTRSAEPNELASTSQSASDCEEQDNCAADHQNRHIVVVLEDGCRLAQVRAMCAEAADTLEFLREPPFFCPFYKAAA
jgi:hypothetical protein